MKKNKISKNWINKQKRDLYVRKSKIDGYRSRAAYKLEEIDQKFNLLKNNIKIIDLGSAPGSWSQYITKKIKYCKTVSIDLKDVEKIKNVTHIIGDFTDTNNQSRIMKEVGPKVDIVLSDMAVNTTGNKNVDSIQTGDLCLQAMLFSKDILNINGKFVSKIFMGSTFNEIVNEAKLTFKETYIYKPPSSRKESKESFIICKKLR